MGRNRVNMVDTRLTEERGPHMTADREQSDDLYRQAQGLVASPDHVDFRIEFDWEPLGPAHLDGDTEQLTWPDGIKVANLPTSFRTKEQWWRVRLLVRWTLNG